VNPGNHPGGLAKLRGSFIMHKNPSLAIVMGPTMPQQKPFSSPTEGVCIYMCISCYSPCVSLTLHFAAPVVFFFLDLNCPLCQDQIVNKNNGGTIYGTMEEIQ
jgi:hypothetical protein